MQWSWRPIPDGEKLGDVVRALNRRMLALTHQLKRSSVITLANDATPSVGGGKLFVTGGTTTITDLDDGVVGDTKLILSAHAITITDGTNILLDGSANFVMADGDVLQVTMFNDQGWEEISRKVN